MELPEVADNLPRVASEKQHGTESQNIWNFLIFDTFGRYIWKAIAPRSKHSGTPKLELEVRRVCTINGSPHPLPVICTCSASTSDYTCRLNIHYLLCMYSFLQLLCQLQKEEQSSLHLPPSHPQPPQLVHLGSVEHSYSHNVCCYTTVMCVIVRIVYMSILEVIP